MKTRKSNSGSTKPHFVQFTQDGAEILINSNAIRTVSIDPATKVSTIQLESRTIQKTISGNVDDTIQAMSKELSSRYRIVRLAMTNPGSGNTTHQTVVGSGLTLLHLVEANGRVLLAWPSAIQQVERVDNFTIITVHGQAPIRFDGHTDREFSSMLDQ